MSSGGLGDVVGMSLGRAASESERYKRLMAKFEALKGANDDAIAEILAGESAKALKVLQRGNKVAAL